MKTVENPQQPVAFVIMPFAPEFNANYNDLIKPALEDAGYEVARADSDWHQENILRKIVKGITRAKLIVAELTTLNPNVLYELGLAHGLGVPTVLLAQSLEEVPFDLRSYNIQTYSTHYQEVPKLRRILTEIGQRHLNGEILFDNPVLDFAPKRMANALVPNGDLGEGAAVDQRIETISEEMGILEANQASQKLAIMMGALVEEINASVSNISPLLERFDALSHDPSGGTSREAQNVAQEISSELDKSSLRIEEYLPEIQENIKIPFQVMLRYLTQLDPEEEPDRQQLVQFRELFGALSERIPVGVKGLKSYRRSVQQIGLRSRVMSPASHRNIQAVEKITDAMGQIEASISRAVQVISERTNVA